MATLVDLLKEKSNEYKPLTFWNLNSEQKMNEVSAWY